MVCSSTFSQQFTQHISRFWEFLVVKQYMQWVTPPSLWILWIDSPVLSERNCDSASDWTKVFSLSQSSRHAAYRVRPLHQSHPGALTGREKSSATFDWLVSLWTGVNKQQQQYFRPTYTALATTFARASTLANITEGPDKLAPIIVQKFNFLLFCRHTCLLRGLWLSRDAGAWL